MRYGSICSGIEGASVARMQETVWHGCYSESLTDVIVPAAFSHPAKMSWMLARRIMLHLAEHWPAVRQVIDPMAGVGVVGLAAAYAGYMAILGELEGHFADLCAQNIAKHADRMRALGKPIPLLFRHDAQHIPLGSADSVVFSPPFATSIQQVNCTQGKGSYAGTDLSQGLNRVKNDYTDYGSHPAQLGNLRAVVSSPPYAMGCREQGTDSKRFLLQGGQNGVVLKNYGDDTRQLQSNDYWSAMAKVYIECARILPPGAPMILVVKGYISKGTYIDLPMQTAQLVDSCGFDVVHWHNASLVSREAQLGLFGGETRTERKSFFRRLAERNGAPPIDAEVVLCAERRGDEHRRAVGPAGCPLTTEERHGWLQNFGHPSGLNTVHGANRTSPVPRSPVRTMRMTVSLATAETAMIAGNNTQPRYTPPKGHDDENHADRR